MKINATSKLYLIGSLAFVIIIILLASSTIFMRDAFREVFASLLAPIVGVIVKLFWDASKSKILNEKVEQAEALAFKVPSDIERNKQEAKRMGEGKTLLNEPKDTDHINATDQIAKLFNLYSKQIEKYEVQTQARAGWSFLLAVASMGAGLGFIIWGGHQILISGDWVNVAAGGTIAAIGGSISAYITKTFLDVHRLSLIQLNHYFRQPVLNAHILTAQRLAEELKDEAAKRGAYENIIKKVSDLIISDPVPLTDINGKSLNTQ